MGGLSEVHRATRSRVRIQAPGTARPHEQRIRGRTDGRFGENPGGLRRSGTDRGAFGPRAHPGDGPCGLASAPRLVEPRRAASAFEQSGVRRCRFRGLFRGSHSASAPLPRGNPYSTRHLAASSRVQTGPSVRRRARPDGGVHQLGENETSWTLAELAEIVGGELHGPPDLRITRPVPAGDDDPTGITFAENSRYLAAAEASKVGAVIVAADEDDCTKPHIKCRAPREAFGRILALSWRDLPHVDGVHPTAVISPDAVIEPGCSIGPYCVVEAHSRICDDAKLFAFCYVGEHCRVGRSAKLYPHTTLYRDVWIGERTIVHAGTVLGADGFGYFWDGRRQRKVPQVGGVRVGDDCEIGALSAIDRATAGETEIGDGTKIDNLVQIAHNVHIGKDTVIASQTGVSGSARIGSRVTVGGQSGFGDHVSVCDDVVLGGKTGVPRNIEKPGEYWGIVARDLRDEMRIQLMLAKLPELFDRVRRLEAEFDDEAREEDAR
ncbi:MAG: UDP-3-O-(3-hydroxymyristoyl)glucosamine N-acyltransferase [Armatimonadetes bacterium]|nr:UDP-3-O-(3-hydroxymyristoyl)glucosamine N-acyltransferase [Armatimonadota bacterium]